MVFSLDGKKVLLTGGTGFIGGSLARRLLARGTVLRVMSRKPEKAEALQKLGAEVVRGDLFEPDSIRKAMDGVDVLVHCAGAIDVFAGWDFYRKIHVEATKDLLQAALDAGVERVFYTSSMIVYGTGRVTGATEEHPYRMSGDRYTDTKIEAERVIDRYIAQGLPVVVLQPTHVYGPGDESWTKKPFLLIKRNLMTMPDGGKGLIHPVFIDDLMEGFEAAFAHGKPGERYLLAGPEPVTIKRFFGEYAKMLGKRWVPSVPRPVAYATAALLEGMGKLVGKTPVFTRDNVIFATMQMSYDGGKAERELGFKADTMLKDGMAEVEAWLKEEGLL